ncbi:MAG: hypothetical protein AAFU77_00360 [Myxococcota bacterium]
MAGVGPTGRVVREIVGEGAETAADVAGDAVRREAADAGTDRVVRDVAGGAPASPAMRATDPQAALAPGATPEPPRFIDDRHRQLASDIAQVDRHLMALRRADPQDPQIRSLEQQWAPFRDELRSYNTIRSVDAELPTLRAAADARGTQDAWNALASAQRNQAEAYARLGMDPEAARGFYEASLAFRSAANTSPGGAGPWMAELRAATLAAARSGYTVQSTGANFANQMRARFGDGMHIINLQMLVGRADEIAGPNGMPNRFLEGNTLAAGRAVLNDFRSARGNTTPISDGGWDRVVRFLNQDPRPMDREIFDFLIGLE